MLSLMYESYKKKILSFYERRKRMPSYAEIMELTGFRSKNAVFKLVEKLVEDGVVEKDEQGRLIPRAIQSGVPFLGLVEAGFPSAAEEELLDIMNFDEYLVPNKEATYILKVKGDSMIDAGIREGDMVIVERKATYKPGQIVIAMVDGAYTMKYLRKKGEKYFLEPANENYKPIYPHEQFRVEAVVTAVVRKY
jgi:SOS regulatory protein LexA